MELVKQIVKVKYLDKQINAYKGRAYTYVTWLPLKIYDKVLCPVGEDEEMNKAIVVETDLPETVIDPEWADRVKEIKYYDIPEVGGVI